MVVPANQLELLGQNRAAASGVVGLAVVAGLDCGELVAPKRVSAAGGRVDRQQKKGLLRQAPVQKGLLPSR
jgi:hypothetical protein